MTEENILEAILLLPPGVAPWHREGLRCVRARVEKLGANVATCITSDGETLLLPASEQIEEAAISRGDVFTALRFETEGNPLLSRARPELVALLAEGVIPELRDGTLRIMDIARMPGVRTKVSVAATTSNIDPVSIAVGKSANRVRALSALLDGERLDIVAWHSDRDQYLINAFAPAEVQEVRENGARTAVFVPQHLMPAAVGERGLNALLAGRLTGVTVEVTPVA